MKERLLKRFLRYISVDTTSDPGAKCFPSTKSQLVFAQMLADELLALGLQDAGVDEYGYVMATFPANTAKKTPVMGLIAHMDTSPDMPGKNISPKIHWNYDGSDIVLNKERGMVMRTSAFPALKQYAGQDLITTDGNTLLGADNKAGIAEIMCALEHLVSHPEIPHGTIKVAFTPDEEIGKGADHFNVRRFGADFAFTIDGGEVGELQYENFNAAFARVFINGLNIHPGEAKGTMINASLLGMAFNEALPEEERPENTAGYEGFYHLTNFQGEVGEANLEYIIRDHDLQRFENKKAKILEVASRLNEKYGDGRVRVEMKDQYFNMSQKMQPIAHMIDLVKTSMEAINIKPLIRPIRGGTDGARLSYMGLPCPNLFTGGHYFHGPYEFISLEGMEKASLLIIKMAEKFETRSEFLLLP